MRKDSARYEDEFDDRVYEDDFYEDEFDEDGFHEVDPNDRDDFDDDDYLEDDEDEPRRKKRHDDDFDDDFDDDKRNRHKYVSYACEDCDYRWEDSFEMQGSLDDINERDAICPMCGSTHVEQI